MPMVRHDWSRFDAKMEAERHAAALADPDAQPFSEEEMVRVTLTPRSRAIRRALRLTPKTFAARCRIPEGSLRDWEEGRAEPDPVARAYLRAIAGEAEGVRRALERGQEELRGGGSGTALNDVG